MQYFSLNTLNRVLEDDVDGSLLVKGLDFVFEVVVVELGEGELFF
jgi:hypothetical protein